MDNCVSVLDVHERNELEQPRLIVQQLKAGKSPDRVFGPGQKTRKSSSDREKK